MSGMGADGLKLPPMSVDLSAVPIEALTKEICSRAKTAVVILQMQSEDDLRPSYWFEGSFYAALGLVDVVHHCMRIQGEKDPDETDL